MTNLHLTLLLFLLAFYVADLGFGQFGCFLEKYDFTFRRKVFLKNEKKNPYLAEKLFLLYEKILSCIFISHIKFLFNNFFYSSLFFYFSKKCPNPELPEFWKMYLPGRIRHLACFRLLTGVFRDRALNSAEDQLIPVNSCVFGCSVTFWNTLLIIFILFI